MTRKIFSSIKPDFLNATSELNEWCVNVRYRVFTFLNSSPTSQWRKTNWSMIWNSLIYILLRRCSCIRFPNGNKFDQYFSFCLYKNFLPSFKVVWRNQRCRQLVNTGKHLVSRQLEKTDWEAVKKLESEVLSKKQTGLTLCYKTIGLDSLLCSRAGMFTLQVDESVDIEDNSQLIFVLFWGSTITFLKNLASDMSS